MTSFDVSRGMAIVLVVLGHAVSAAETVLPGPHGGWDLFNEVFHLVRMPLFFFLAGVFLIDTLRKRGYRGWVIDKAQYLLYPWLVWSVLRALLDLGLARLGIGGEVAVDDLVRGIVWDPRIWYLPALFLAFAVIGGAYALCRGRRWWALVAALLLVVLIPVSAAAWWPPVLAVHPFSVYMLAGCVLGTAAIIVARGTRWFAGLLAVGLGMLFAVAVIAGFGLGMLPDDVSLAFVVCAALGVGAFVAAGRLIDGTLVGRGLQRLGRWSLVIYVVHAVPTSATRMLLIEAGVREFTVVVLASAAMGVAVPALLAWLNDRGRLRWLTTMPGYRRRA